MPTRPRALRAHHLTTPDEIERRAQLHNGTVIFGGGWITLDLGKGRRYCAVDVECASLEVCS